MAGPGTVPARIRLHPWNAQPRSTAMPRTDRTKEHKMLRKLLIAAGMSYLYRRFAGGRRGSRGAAPRW